MLDYCKQCVKISVKALLANKARSFLTMLGIIIGVGAVIVIMAVGAGAQSLILAQVKTLGTNLIGVMPGKSEEAGPPTAAMGIVITTLTYDDAMALRDPKNAPNIVEAVAYTIGIGTVSWESNSYDTNLKGSTAGYLEVEGGEVGQGRFFTEEEEKNMARVAVLGGIIGIVGGVIVSYLIAVGAHLLGYSWEFIVSLFSVILAVSVSMLVGLVFGLYPARKASKLVPVEALRYE